jgi:hypothetical protein
VPAIGKAVCSTCRVAVLLLALATLVPASAAAAPEPLGSWGGKGSDPGRFASDASGIAVAPGGTVYVADAGNHRLQAFSPIGTPLSAWSLLGRGVGRLNRPAGVAVDALGRVYVTEAPSARVHVLSPRGELLATYGGPGSGHGRLSRPTGVAVAGDGTVLVADTGNRRVQAFSPSGGFLRAFGEQRTGPGALAGPVGVAVAPRGDVYVTDAAAGRVVRFAADGSPLGRWSVASAGRAVASDDDDDDDDGWGPTGIAVDRTGRVHVADPDRHRVLRFSAEGSLEEAWGRRGSAPGALYRPAGLAPDCRGSLYLMDAGNHRVQRFGARGARPAPCLPPVARLAVAPAPALVGQAVTFDASSSFDPDGSIVRHEWDLDGDGAYESDTGPVSSVMRAYTSPAALQVRLRVTDDEGERSVAVERLQVESPPPPPAPAAPASSPPGPVLGVSTAAAPVSGSVLVRRPGERSFRALGGWALLPVGTAIDATSGRVRLGFATAPGPGAPTQEGVFYEGVFGAFQAKTSGLVELRLDDAATPSARGAVASARQTRRAKRKRLWGRARGRFRTAGRNAAATVRGTTWLTEDNDRGTRVHVRTGSVDVHDLVRNRRVVVPAGKSYEARDPCASRRRFAIRLRVPPGVAVRRATVTVDGRPVRVRVGRRLTAVVDLRGATRRRHEVRIVLHTTSGARITGTRRYLSCAKKRPPGAPPRI